MTDHKSHAVPSRSILSFRCAPAEPSRFEMFDLTQKPCVACDGRCASATWRIAVAPHGYRRIAYDHPFRCDPTLPTSAVTVAQRSPTLPISTLQQAIRVASDRTRRMTLLGQVPVLGIIAWPWVFPLHLLIVGLTADHIRHTPDASLSYSDGIPPRRHFGAIAAAVALGVIWLVWAYQTVTWLSGSRFWVPAVVVAVIFLSAPLIELLSLLQFAVCNPEWTTLKRDRDSSSGGRPAYVLTSLVSRQDGLGHAGALMDLTYPQWQAADAVVIGYPASKSLISYYVRLGARRRLGAAGTGRPAGRSVAFDCRRPLRRRPAEPSQTPQPVQHH